MDLPKKIVIFDFDGTIADTLPVAFDILSKILAENGRTNPDELVAEFRDVGAHGFMRLYHISNFKIYFAIRRIRRALTTRMKDVALFPHLKEELYRLHKAGYRLGILSSNDKVNIELFLDKYGMSDIIDFIFSERNIFAKAAKLKFMIKYFKFSKDDVIYVGDEVRDVEAAQKAGVAVVAVSWGYNGAELLKSAKPDLLISDEKMLLPAIKSLQ